METKSKYYLAVPPGATIQEQLDDKRISKAEFAEKMHISKDRATQLLNGDIELTYIIAFQLEDLLGIPARYWMNLETIYRERLKHVR